MGIPFMFVTYCVGCQGMSRFWRIPNGDGWCKCETCGEQRRPTITVEDHVNQTVEKVDDGGKWESCGEYLERET